MLHVLHPEPTWYIHTSGEVGGRRPYIHTLAQVHPKARHALGGKTKVRFVTKTYCYECARTYAYLLHSDQHLMHPVERCLMSIVLNNLGSMDARPDVQRLTSHEGGATVQRSLLDLRDQCHASRFHTRECCRMWGSTRHS